MRRSDNYKKSASQCWWDASGVSRASISDMNKQDIKLQCSWGEARGMPGNMLNYPWELESAASLFREDRRESSKKQSFQVKKSKSFTSKDA